MDEKYNAICIRSVLWRESDKLLTLFSLENGKVDCVVRGAMSPKSKWRFACEPFSFCEYVLTEKLGKKTLTEATQIDGFYDIRYDMDKLYCASAVIEFIRQNVVEDMKTYGLFYLTVSLLGAIEKGEYPYLALIKFFIGAVGELGYDINLDCCHKCGSEIKDRAYFDFDVAAPTCENCADGNSTEIRKDTYLLLRAASALDVEELKNSDLSTYSPIFQDKKSVFYALKFMAYYMEIKLNCKLKALSDILDGFNF